MSVSNKNARLGCFFVFTLVFGILMSIQQSCAMEQDQSENFQPPQVEITEVQGNKTEKLDLTPDYTLHVLPNFFTENNDSLYGIVSRSWIRLMWGITAYGIVTSPKVQNFCSDILPYLPIISCLTVGGLYALHPYAKEWVQKIKDQREEQRKREWEEIRQKVQAESDAKYVKIYAETAEMFKHFNTDEDTI